MSYKISSLFIAIVVGLSACGEKKNPQEAASEVPKTFCLDSTFKSGLSFIKPGYGKVSEAIHLTGSIEANPDRVVSFVSLVSGVVTSVNFSIGDKVRKGQVLAEMQSTELSALQSELTAQKSRIELAEKRLNSVKGMFADGVASERELMEAQSDLAVLQADLTRTSANLNLYSASMTKGVFQLLAPASGVVTSKSVTAGSQISPETGPLFTVSDLSQIWILANIHATNVAHITEGMGVDITTLSYPDEQFKGKITNINSVMDEEAKVLKARIELPNKDMKLKPGMLVDINVIKPVDRSAWSLPTSSLVFDDNRNYVVVYRSDCNLAIRQVDIIAQNEYTTYLSDGPDSTESVIGRNQLLVFEQLKNFQN